MKVINILADGTVVEDMSQITVPLDNPVYDVCKRIFIEEGKNEKSNLLLGGSYNARSVHG
jgi:hypothetical protein